MLHKMLHVAVMKTSDMQPKGVMNHRLKTTALDRHHPPKWKMYIDLNRWQLQSLVFNFLEDCFEKNSETLRHRERNHNFIGYQYLEEESKKVLNKKLKPYIHWVVNWKVSVVIAITILDSCLYGVQVIPFPWYRMTNKFSGLFYLIWVEHTLQFKLPLINS